MRSGLKGRTCKVGTWCCVLGTVLLPLLAGCAARISAEKVSTARGYAQVEANALRTGRPSAETAAVLQRFDLSGMAARQADQALAVLHEHAVVTGERDLLFALAETSYLAAEQIRRSVKPWDARIAQDYYLGSAVYAWLFLFGESKDPPPSPFDRRFRAACDFYNYSLGLALTQSETTNGVVRLEAGRRRLPVGEIELDLNAVALGRGLADFESFLLANEYRVRGYTSRIREAGLGVPLIGVLPARPELKLHQTLGATVVLRIQGGCGDLKNGKGALEVYANSPGQSIRVGKVEVPVEFDFTAYHAYALGQTPIWRLGRRQFLAPGQRIPNQLVLSQPYEPGLIPLVFIHGTFASPVTWAETVNALTADPVLRRNYQVWLFNYGSGNPLVTSIGDLRTALTAEIERLDPVGTNTALRRMVVIGHSQGGLLAKATAIHSGDRLWTLVNTNRLEDLEIDETKKAELRRLLFFEPLPFVRRVVFIATPHRGSYLSTGLARRLARRLVSLPKDVLSGASDLLRVASGPREAEFMQGGMPTSIDGMSPRNPGLLAMADIPVEPPIKAHSIIPVLGQGDIRKGRDGVVTYESAHVDYVESEFIVRSGHSCQQSAATIGELRRILYQHLEEDPARPQRGQAAAVR